MSKQLKIKRACQCRKKNSRKGELRLKNRTSYAYAVEKHLLKNRARHIYKLLKICKYDGLGPPNKDHINSANFYESIKNQQFL